MPGIVGVSQAHVQSQIYIKGREVKVTVSRIFAKTAQGEGVLGLQNQQGDHGPTRPKICVRLKMDPTPHVGDRLPDLLWTLGLSCKDPGSWGLLTQ